MDAISYEEIAQAMETSVPSVKSLLVRARISLAEASQARQLTCGEVRLELAEAAEGLRKVSSPVRRHVRDCDECADFRAQVRSNDKALAALFPVGPLIAFKAFVASKLGFGGAGAGGGAAASAGARRATATGAVGSVGAAISSSSAAGGIGAVGGAIGTKAVAGVVTAAVITAGAVEVKQNEAPSAASHKTPVARVSTRNAPAIAPAHVSTPPAPAPAPASGPGRPHRHRRRPNRQAPLRRSQERPTTKAQASPPRTEVALDPTVPATGITDAAPSTPGAHGTDRHGRGHRRQPTTSPPPPAGTAPPAEPTSPAEPHPPRTVVRTEHYPVRTEHGPHPNRARAAGNRPVPPVSSRSTSPRGPD